MKTTLFLTALFISTITFAQTSKKGYDYYKNASDNRAASATDYNSSRSNKSEDSGIVAPNFNGTQTNIRTRTPKFNSRSRSNKNLHRKAPKNQNNNKPNKQSSATDYNSSRSNKSEDSRK